MVDEDRDSVGLTGVYREGNTFVRQDESMEKEKSQEDDGLTEAEKLEQREAHRSAMAAVRELPGTESVASQFPHLVDKAVDAFLKERMLTDQEVALMGKERDLPPMPPHTMVGVLSPAGPN